MIYTVTLNPAIDKTVQVPGFTLDAVNRVTELRQDAGGKGINVSKVIAKLGGTSEAWVILAGQSGQWLENALAEMGIATHAVWVDGQSRTNLKVVDADGHTNTDINEPGPQIDDTLLNKMLAELSNTVAAGDIVVLSGSLPQGVARDTYETWGRVLRMMGCKVFLDADGDALKAGLAARPYFTKPNDHELSALVGRALTTPVQIAAAAQELVARGINTVCISMGSKGGLLATEKGTWFSSPVKVKVGSTVGAGDSVVAAFAFAEESGMDVAESLKLAMATGAANVMESGTQAAERTVVESLLSQVTVEAFEV